MQIPQNWTFKSDHIADHFDQHVREQLPWYDLATFATAQMARHYVPQGGKVYDIGCATGNMGRVLAGTLSDSEARGLPLGGLGALCMHEAPIARYIYIY